jgi:hypothetical protein
VYAFPLTCYLLFLSVFSGQDKIVTTVIRESRILPRIGGVFTLVMVWIFLNAELSASSVLLGVPFALASAFCLRLAFSPRIVIIVGEDRKMRFYPENKVNQHVDLDQVRNLAIEKLWERNGDGVGITTRLRVETHDAVSRIILPILGPKGNRDLADLIARVNSLNRIDPGIAPDHLHKGGKRTRDAEIAPVNEAMPLMKPALFTLVYALTAVSMLGAQPPDRDSAQGKVTARVMLVRGLDLKPDVLPLRIEIENNSASTFAVAGLESAGHELWSPYIKMKKEWCGYAWSAHVVLKSKNPSSLVAAIDVPFAVTAQVPPNRRFGFLLQVPIPRLGSGTYDCEVSFATPKSEPQLGGGVLRLDSSEYYELGLRVFGTLALTDIAYDGESWKVVGPRE